MANPFRLPLTAAQVGTYFVGQYYQALQHQPDFVHQFYSDASTMLRIDGNTRETAATMLRIHALVMSLNYTGVEIKTAHPLESLNGGVLVMVSGSVRMKNFSGKRKFMQTFFLAPQEKGFFVLNDIFHFIDDEPLYSQPVAYLGHDNSRLLLNASATVREPASNYVLGGETRFRDFVSPADIEENGLADNYSFSELQRQQQVAETESILQNDFTWSNGSHHKSMIPVPDHLSAPAEESSREPQKHTYASIVAKRISATPAPPQASFNKSMPAVSELDSVSEPHTQQSVSSLMAVEKSGPEAAFDFSSMEDEGEIKSVYVRNLPSTVSPSEIGEEFKKFGRLKPNDAVAIRNRKDIGVCYAFVEFEDVIGVQNAIKASTAQIAGQQVFIEERRPNRINAYRGGKGRGRGRGGYPPEAFSGRFGGRNFGRGNGLYRAASQQDSYRNGQHQ